MEVPALVSTLPMPTRQLRQRVLYADRRGRERQTSPQRRSESKRLPSRPRGAARRPPQVLQSAEETMNANVGRHSAVTSMLLAECVGSPSVPLARQLGLRLLA